MAPEDFAELHREGLAAWCARRLPAHMVPQQIFCNMSKAALCLFISTLKYKHAQSIAISLVFRRFVISTLK